jgi:hypothetical protein
MGSTTNTARASHLMGSTHHSGFAVGGWCRARLDDDFGRDVADGILAMGLCTRLMFTQPFTPARHAWSFGAEAVWKCSANIH